ncbi:MAG: hypothetical protein QOK11_2654 [Pseudonocardiales bacterium]|nr:hypothetical protein [Pseudonocardiales bacterium]
MKESLSVRSLDQRFQNVADKDQILAYRLRVTVANVVVGQMLPPGAVKGGTAMKIRLGESGSRFTPDLDTARRESLAQFIEAFEDALGSGWHGFTGRLIARPGARPAGVPAPYVMRPYEVKLAFQGKSWHTVKLELGHNEIGDADDPVFLLADEIAQLFADVGLPQPAPIAVMRADHQIAQKLHACTGAGNERAHDLVDLQLLVSAEELDLAHVRETSVRLFNYRQAQPWPPTVVAGPTWSGIYDEAGTGLKVVPNVDSAVDWANELIARIDSAT